MDPLTPWDIMQQLQAAGWLTSPTPSQLNVIQRLQASGWLPTPPATIAPASPSTIIQPLLSLAAGIGGLDLSADIGAWKELTNRLLDLQWRMFLVDQLGEFEGKPTLRAQLEREYLDLLRWAQAWANAMQLAQMTGYVPRSWLGTVFQGRLP